jgi:hypothetical protein
MERFSAMRRSHGKLGVLWTKTFPGDPGWLWTGKVPSVDGLRAVAMLCLLLVRERAKNERLSLKGFYKRRIMPAYLSYLAVRPGSPPLPIHRRSFGCPASARTWPTRGR